VKYAVDRERIFFRLHTSKEIKAVCQVIQKIAVLVATTVRLIRARASNRPKGALRGQLKVLDLVRKIRRSVLDLSLSALNADLRDRALPRPSH
jgi:hypothetical protein